MANTNDFGIKPQINMLTPEQLAQVEAYEKKMEEERRLSTDEAARCQIKWLKEFRNPVSTVPMRFYRNPRFHYAVLYIFAALLAVLPVAGFAYIAMAAIAFVTDGGDVNLAPMYPVIGVVASLIPIAATFYWQDALFTTVQNDEVAFMEFWETPLQRLGFKPLGAGRWLAPPPFFDIKKFPQVKESIPITGNLDVTFEISVQGVMDPTLQEEEGPGPLNPNAAVTDRISLVEFGGLLNIAPDISDFRSIILLNSITGGMKKAGNRLAEATVSAFRNFSASLKGPGNQYEAMAFGEYAAAKLTAGIMKDVCATGTTVETINPKIQLPKDLRDAIKGSNIEDAESTKTHKDAVTAAKARYVRQTGDSSPTEEKIAAWAADPANWLPADMSALQVMMVEGTASKDSLKIISTGGDREAATAEKILELIKDKDLFSGGAEKKIIIPGGGN